MQISNKSIHDVVGKKVTKVQMIGHICWINFEGGCLRIEAMPYSRGEEGYRMPLKMNVFEESSKTKIGAKEIW